MQAKQKYDDEAALRLVDYELKNPSLMTYFSVNRHGVEVYTHADKRRKQRGRCDIGDFWKVDLEDVIEAFQWNFLQFMNETESEFVVCAGVELQHTHAVYESLEDNDVCIHPSACGPHNIITVYPQHSHCFVPQDHRMLSQYQTNISVQCRDRNVNNEDNKRVFIFDRIHRT